MHSLVNSIFTIRYTFVWCLSLCVFTAPLAGAAQQVERAREELLGAIKSYPGEIKFEWNEFLSGIERRDHDSAERAFAEIMQLKKQAGYVGLDSYALSLAERGSSRWKQGDKESAIFLFRKALQLSPNSPKLLIRILPWSSQIGSGSVTSLLWRIAQGVFNDPFLIITVIQRSMYPALLALTAALFVIFLFVIVCHAAECMRYFARVSAPAYRGIVLPLFVVLLFGVPVFFGPLWTLFVWGGVLRFVLPEKRFLSLATALLLILWGVCIPLRENLTGWINDPAVRLVAQGNVMPLEPHKIIEMTENMESWNEDASVVFRFAQLLRQNGELDLAEANFNRVEGLLGEQSWITAERGMVAFLKGDSLAAEALMKHAQEQGEDSAQFLMNYSKVLFDLTETAKSRELLSSIQKSNPKESEYLREREDTLGMFHPRAVADINLPIIRIVSAAMDPQAESFAHSQRMADLLMPGCDAQRLTVIGVGLFILYALGGGRPRRVRPAGIFEGYRRSPVFDGIARLVPGITLVLQGRPGRGLFILSGIFLLFAPLLELPLQGSLFGDIAPSLLPYYLLLCVLLYLAVVYVGFSDQEAA